ncbi:membrane progestin receptor gamma-B-like [Tubulanus polymorphus]|uniref:membrane progestin receptor gamma-B-like n=1 Tax=Tubulanus polymorphus TaxID=672921 RepID=UPI003DA36FED
MIVGGGVSTTMYDVEEVPDLFKEPYIQSGYRGSRNTLLQCVGSIFTVHNETLNVWTHLLPALALLAILLYKQTEWLSDAYTVPLAIVFLTTSGYMLSSAVAHIFNAMSTRARHLCFMVDYAALSVYGYGASVAHFTYSIPEYWIGARYLWIYLPTSLLVSTVCTIISFTSRFLDTHSKRIVCRLGAFVMPYLHACIPIIFRLVFCASEATPTSVCHSVGTSGYLYMNCLAVLAVFFYITKIPEKYLPGCFDRVGHSHQWFHTLCVIGSFIHLRCLVTDMKEREDYMITNHVVPDKMWTSYCFMFVIGINSIFLLAIFCYLSFVDSSSLGDRRPRFEHVAQSTTNGNSCSQQHEKSN